MFKIFKREYKPIFFYCQVFFCKIVDIIYFGFSVIAFFTPYKFIFIKFKILILIKEDFKLLNAYSK
jgi:hypothetical protein